MKYAKTIDGKAEFLKNSKLDEGYLPVKETECPKDGVYIAKYTKSGKKILQSWEKCPDYEAIAQLERELDFDRYKLDKIHEYSLLGLPCPYTAQELEQYHEKREAIRERIRILKGEADGR